MSEVLTRTELKKERTRARLVDAALEIFEEYGYHKAKVRDITEKADLGYGTFYKYFKNKQELMLYLANDMCSHIGDYLYETNYKGLPIKDKIYYGLHDVFKFCFVNKTVYLTMQEAKTSDEAFAECEQKVFDSLYNRIKKDVDYFIKKGFCRESVNDDSVFLITCMVNRGIQVKMKEAAGEEELEQTVKTLTQMVYNLLIED